MVRNILEIVAAPVALMLTFAPNVARPQHAVEPTLGSFVDSLTQSLPTTTFDSRLFRETTVFPAHFAPFSWEPRTIAPRVLRTPKSSQASNQTLRLDVVEINKTSHTLESVLVRVRNITAEPRSGIIWYVLSLPGEPEPWRVYEYSSEERAIELAAHQTQTLALEGPDVPLDGQYTLSVWLHGLHPNTQERFHSDHWESHEPVSIAPPFYFSVDYLKRQNDEEGGFQILVRFSVRNNRDEKTSVNFLYSIGSSEDEATPEMERIKRAPAIAPGVSYVLTVRHDQGLPPGQYVLTGWLYELVDDDYQLQATSRISVELEGK